LFVEVPEPVWKTSIGNWSSCFASAISRAAAAIRAAEGCAIEQAQLAVDLSRGRL